VKRIQISQRVAVALIQSAKLNLGIGKDVTVVAVKPARGGASGPGSLWITYKEAKK